jgi:cytochrome c oxidase cbb3-type subunit 1
MTDQQTYNYKVVRQFAIMAIVWAIVGMAVGVLIAAQLAWPVLNRCTPTRLFLPSAAVPCLPRPTM